MLSLRSLPIAFRALFSSFLILIGVGYLMALSFMYLVVIEPHQQMGQGLVAGISDEYHGLPKGKTLIEAALMGPMADKLSVADRTRLLTWVHDGAKAATYPQVKPIFAANCISCHMAGAQSIPPLASFEAVQKVAKADTGTSITDLAKVSHIHLFGISIIFLLTGAIFALSETPVWLRVISRRRPLFDHRDGYRFLVVHQISRSGILRLRRCRRWSVHGSGARCPDSHRIMGNVD